MIPSEYANEIITFLREHPEYKNNVLKAIALASIQYAIKHNDIKGALEVAEAYKQYIPQMYSFLRGYLKLNEQIKNMYSLVNRLYNDIVNGKIADAEKIYNESLQGVIPSIIEELNRYGKYIPNKDKILKTLYDIQTLIGGLIQSAKYISNLYSIAKKINSLLEQLPKPSSSNAEEYFGLASKIYKQITTLIEKIEPPPQQLINAINILKERNSQYYKVLENIYNMYENLKRYGKIFLKLAKLYTLLSRAFKDYKRLEDILSDVASVGITNKTGYWLNIWLSQFASDIMALQGFASKNMGVYISSGKGMVSLGDIANTYANNMLEALQNIVNALSKTNDYRIYDIIYNALKPYNIGLKLPAPPPLYYIAPLKYISETIHNIIDYNRSFFRKALMEFSTAPYNPVSLAKLILGGLGLVGASLIDCLTMILRPKDMYEAFKFLWRGFNTLITNPSGWLRGAENVLHEMTSTPYGIATLITTGLLLPLTYEAISSLPRNISAVVRTVTDILQGDPLSTIDKLIKITRLEPKLRIAVNRVEGATEKYFLGYKNIENIEEINNIIKEITGKNPDFYIKQLLLERYGKDIEYIINEAEKIRKKGSLINKIITVLKNKIQKLISSRLTNTMTPPLEHDINTLKEELKQYVTSKSVKLGVMAGPKNVEKATIEAHTLMPILNRLETGLEELKTIEPKLYEEISPAIRRVIADLRSGKITGTTIRYLTQVKDTIRKALTLPQNLEENLAEMLSKIRESTSNRAIAELVTDIKRELKNIEPLPNKLVYVFGSLDKAEYEHLPLFLAPRDVVSKIRELFSTRIDYSIVTPVGRVVVKRYGEYGSGFARLVYYIELPKQHRWVKVIYEWKFIDNPRNYFRKTMPKLYVVKKVVYDPEATPVVKPILELISNENTAPRILRGIDELKYIYIPMGRLGYVDVVKILRNIPLILAPTRAVSPYDLLRYLLKTYGVLAIRIGNKIEIISSIKQLEEVLPHLGQLPSTIEIETPKQLERAITSTIAPVSEKGVVPPVTPSPKPSVPALPPLIPVVSFGRTSAVGKIGIGVMREKLVI